MGMNSTQRNVWTFYENSSFKMETYDPPSEEGVPAIQFSEDENNNRLTITSTNGLVTQWAGFKAEGNKLTFTNLQTTSGSTMDIPSLPLSYTFSSDGNSFTLNVMIFSLEFTKITESIEPTTTGPFAWENINISVDVGFSGTINWDWINLTRSSVPYSGDHAPAEWENVAVGDVIETGIYEEHVSGDLTWIPTDSTIGYFYFWTFDIE